MQRLILYTSWRDNEGEWNYTGLFEEVIMWIKVYRRLFYLAMMLSLAGCGALEGVGKGLGGMFKSFGKFIP